MKNTKNKSIQTDITSQYILDQNKFMDLSFKFVENQPGICQAKITFNQLPNHLSGNTVKSSSQSSHQPAYNLENNDNFHFNGYQKIAQHGHMKLSNLPSSQVTQLIIKKKAQSSLISDTQLQDRVPQIINKTPFQKKISLEEYKGHINENNQKCNNDGNDKISQGLSQSLAIQDGKNSLRYKLQASSSRLQQDSLSIHGQDSIPINPNKKPKHRINHSDTITPQTLDQVKNNFNQSICMSLQPKYDNGIQSYNLDNNNSGISIGGKVKTGESVIDNQQNCVKSKNNDNNQEKLKQQVIQHVFIINISNIKIKKSKLKNMQWLNQN